MTVPALETTQKLLIKKYSSNFITINYELLRSNFRGAVNFHLKVGHCESAHSGPVTDNSLSTGK